MGKLLNHQEIIENNINAYNEALVEDYSRYLEGTPTFCTYFSRDITNSTRDVALEDVDEIIGKESPFVYHKITNFVIYGLDGFNPNTEKTEYGLNTDIEGEVIILPNTIKPLSYDYFEIKHANKRFLFEVKSVNNDRIEGKTFYKLGFSLSSKKVKDINSQTSEDEYCLIYENLGTNTKPIVKQEEYFVINFLENLYDLLIDTYKSFYYNEKFNILEYKYNDINLYNQLGTIFISKHDIMKKMGMSIYDTLYIRDILELDLQTQMNYKRSLYYCLESKVSLNLEGDSILPRIIVNKHSPFYYSYCKYYNIFFINFNNKLMDINNLIIYPIFEPTFISKIKKNALYKDNKKFLLYNIIIKYINSTSKITSQDIKSILDDINNNFDFLPTLENYLLIPMILYILKKFKDIIEVKI